VPWNPTLAHRTRKDGAFARTFWFEKIKVKNRVNGSGQECPLYTYFGISSATVS
jgi:hypothetical protein